MARVEFFGAAGAASGLSGFDDPGLGDTLIAGNVHTPLEVLANAVGPDIVGDDPSHPLNFRRLEGSATGLYAPIANGDSTRYGEIIDYLMTR
jgi:hypothetical protein